MTKSKDFVRKLRVTDYWLHKVILLYGIKCKDSFANSSKIYYNNKTKIETRSGR